MTQNFAKLKCPSKISLPHYAPLFYLKFNGRELTINKRTLLTNVRIASSWRVGISIAHKY